MKLVTFTHAGGTRAGVLTESSDIADIGAPMIELLTDGTLIERANKAFAGGTTIPATEAAIEAPVPRPPKVVAIGLNYRDHAEESGQPIPQRPVVFAKMPTCVVGPDHPIYIPRVSRAVDWEAELCFVIGKRARYVTRRRRYAVHRRLLRRQRRLRPRLAVPRSDVDDGQILRHPRPDRAVARHA